MVGCMNKNYFKERYKNIKSLFHTETFLYLQPLWGTEEYN